MQGLRVGSLSEHARGLIASWRVLGPEQRVAAVASILLIVSTFGTAFSWVEAAEILAALAVLALLKRRADGYEFHLPFGDGTAIAAAGVWCGVLILIRLFDRPLGQNLLALACAALLFAAGIRERAKRPMDDLPPAAKPASPRREAEGRSLPETRRISPSEDLTERLPAERESPPAPPPP
jgi:hypothetical protein